MIEMVRRSRSRSSSRSRSPMIEMVRRNLDVLRAAEYNLHEREEVVEA